MAPTIDFDNTPRPQGQTIDIGPYEYITSPQSYTLTLHTHGNGIITANPDQPIYQQGDLIQITATPNIGWIFDHWEGDQCGTTNPMTITMNTDKTITAYFTEQILPQIVTITDIQPTHQAIQIQITTDQLSATINNNKQTPITWTITTNPNIGTQTSSIIQGTITCPINNLQYDTTYTWTIHLQTENGWQNESYQFTTEETPIPPEPDDGDMNGDGKLNPADVHYLAKYLIGHPNFTPLHSNGDVNCDGTVNSVDIRYLALYIAGDPNFTPLYPTC
jgi:hypothetical protein